jgi:hypothetical protein
MAASDLYEVRCTHCEVSFPPGTKQCLHCGGRIGRRLRQAPPPPVMRSQNEQPSDFLAYGADSPPEGKLIDLSELAADSEDEARSSSPRRAVRLGVNVLWIFGALMITLAQMCRGGG